MYANYYRVNPSILMLIHYMNFEYACVLNTYAHIGVTYGQLKERAVYSLK